MAIGAALQLPEPPCSIIIVVPYPLIYVIVVTTPPRTVLIAEPGCPLISIPGFSVVVLSLGFHWLPNFAIIRPCAGHGSCPFSALKLLVLSASCC